MMTACTQNKNPFLTEWDTPYGVPPFDKISMAYYIPAIKAGIKQQEKELARKERTHRLCTHGAMLEQYLPPEEYTDDEIDKILRTVFQNDSIRQFVSSVKEHPYEQPET